MRFIRSARHPFTDTARKRAALARGQKAERETLPLFAAEIAAHQKSSDDVMQDRANAWAASEARNRQRRADQWRRASPAAAQGPGGVGRRALSRRSGLSAGFPAQT
ncbi:hypothetical protein [Paracoccus salsus]|uniref:hypothetical protein n=1 Tax=Paracoccus salsus TaxID=2911061 RepID=UPI001F3C8C62|nr:hypothetical protein [Paracoccus salsus]MCF3975002.1 hypothetical protein [Paracoccus salsus]